MKDVATRGRRVDRAAKAVTVPEAVKARRGSGRNLSNSELAELFPITSATWERESGQSDGVPAPIRWTV